MFLRSTVVIAVIAVIAVGIVPLVGCRWLKKPNPEVKVDPRELVRNADYPNEGVQLGNGWNSGMGLKTSSRCVTFNEASDDAQEKDLTLSQVVDKYNMMEEMNVSVSMQVKGAVAQASGKADFARKVELQEENANFVVNAHVRNGAKYAVPPSGGKIDLTRDSARLAKDNPGEFLRQCGDSYVSSIYGGAELFVVLNFRTKSLDERQTLAASIQGGGWGFEASGSVSSALKKYTETQQLNIVYHQSGGSSDPIPTDQAGFLTQVHNLPTAAASHPKFYSISVTRYDTLPSWPKRQAQWIYAEQAPIASQYGRFVSLRDSVDTLVQTPALAVLDRGTTLQDLKKIEDELTGHVRSITETANRCLSSSGTDCKLSEKDLVSDYTNRVHLPAIAGSFVEDIALTNQTAEVNRLRNELAHTPVNNVVQAFGGTFVVPNPEYPKKKTAVATAEKVLNDQTAKYPDAAKEAILTQWIKVPSQARCRTKITDPGCLTNAQIDDLAKQIQVK